MKGDFTRRTFQREKHYHAVQMQQGRVQVDADWNEQVDITSHRIETESRDLIGLCGVPIHAPNSFRLVPEGNDIAINRGRIYADGILCENEQTASFTHQPDLPVTPLPAEHGVYLAYLDVWLRHITALDDRTIREVALGGPDTATRTKTVWQLKLVRAANVGTDIHCLSDPPAWTAVITPPSGQLSARTAPGEPETKPCIIPAAAGYRRLENQLYRVEIHKGGSGVEATFKWSRDNGTVVSTWEAQSTGKDELTIASAGPDKVLNFRPGQWIELTDNSCELLGKQGTLVQILRVDGNILKIDPTTAGGTIERGDFPLNPKVRRWDQVGAAADVKGGVSVQLAWVGLEDGVEVKFSAGTYRTGDYWLIPARTGLPNEPAAGDVEWPKIPGTQSPAPQSPHGIEHHFCRLGVLTLDAGGWQVIHDCRQPFPPATELTSLFYLSGDGQEATADPTQPAKPVPLPQPLLVGVANGRWPVDGATIQFKILSGGGTLKSGATSGSAISVKTGTTGVAGTAQCNWELGPSSPNQQVEAILTEDGGQPVHLPVRFNAKLEPSVDSCCSMVVSDGEGLVEAIQLAAKKGIRDVCICLLAGRYKVGKIAIQGGIENLTLEGCGPSCSTITQADKWEFIALNSCTLRDLRIDVVGIESPIQFVKCNSVTLDSCQVTQTNSKPNSSTLMMLGVERLRVTNNKIETLLEDRRISPNDVLKDIPPVAKALAAPDDATFAQTAGVAAKELASAKLADRKTMHSTTVKTIERLAKKQGAQEFAVYDRLLDELITDEPNTDSLFKWTSVIRDAFRDAPPGVAMVIDDARVRITVENNEITGDVGLYGRPGGKDLSSGEIQDLGKAIHGSKIKFSRSSGVMHVAHNRMTRMVISETITSFLRTLIQTGGDITGVLENSLITSNVFTATQAGWLSRELNMTGNAFKTVLRDSAGTAVAEFAVFVGNSANGDEVSLSNVSRMSLNQKQTLVPAPGGGTIQIPSGNLLINIVNF